jgi:nucleotide-binding universal stress UspA family protein
MTARKDFHVRQVLFASDFSLHSDHAFEAALALARHFGACLHLVHVTHHARDAEEARDRLRRFAVDRVAAVEFAVSVATGRPGPEIVAYAEREKIDVIVMGTHGATGLRHIVHGSVAEAVVRHAPCLVLTIRLAAGLPLEAAEPGLHGPGEMPPADPGRGRRCLVCAQPSAEVVCPACKTRIEAEAFHHSGLRGLVNSHGDGS